MVMRDLALLVPLFGVVCALTVFGVHRGWLAWRWWRLPAPSRPAAPAVWPTVTVQLPVFEERLVVARLVESAGRMRYPRDRFRVQVLDDSRDDTTDLARAAVDALRRAGVEAVLLHREDRAGFKAGALAAGLAATDSELVAVFDADFVPTPDFLEQAVPWFADPEVGMVQGRWGHLNADESWLTAAQALLLDGHFAIEHAARHRAGRWFNFNGTAGVWRRRAIDEAGGWSHDTLTEDLDLSYRAQLAGWRFVALAAEMPLAAIAPRADAWWVGLGLLLAGTVPMFVFPRRDRGPRRRGRHVRPDAEARRSAVGPVRGRTPRRAGARVAARRLAGPRVRDRVRRLFVVGAPARSAVRRGLPGGRGRVDPRALAGHGRVTATRRSARVGAEELVEVRHRRGAHDAVDRLPAEDGDGRHTVRGGDARGLVDIQLPDARATLPGGRDLVHAGADHPARAAPWRPEVDEHGPFGPQDLLLEVVVGEGQRVVGGHP
jgi:hypothetical protein